MHILLTGSTGFIGRTLHAALRAAGHTVFAGVSPRTMAHEKGQVAMDFARDTSPQAWLPRLHGIDAVVNTVGVLRDSPSRPIDAVHQHTPIALFDACAQVGVRRVIHLSALGIEHSSTRYAQTKYAAYRRLQALGEAGLLNPMTLCPSVVFGHGGASSALFMGLARLPLVIFPAPMLTAQIQPISVHDLAAAVVALLGTALGQTGTLVCAGPASVRMADFVASLRAQQGRGPAVVLRLPLPLTHLSARLGDWMPASVPWCSESLAMLAIDNVGDSAPLATLLGRSPVHYSQLVARAYALSQT